MAFLAIDWGEKRIGLALGTIYPQPAGVIDGSAPLEKITGKIREICEDNDIEKIIVGLPIRSGGEEGHRAPEIRKFAESIFEATGLPIIFEPEQFTSIEAEAYLKSRGKKVQRESGAVDEIAAVLLLEQYLNHHENKL